MLSAATSLSRHHHYETAARFTARQALSRLEARPDLALVFATIHHREHFPALLEIIRKQTGAEFLTGSSAYGVLTETGDIEDGPGLSLMLLKSHHLHFHPFMLPNLQENNFFAGSKAGQFLRTIQPSPAALFLFPDHFSFQAPLFLEGMETEIDHIPIWGATSTDDGSLQKAYQFYGSHVAFDAVSGFSVSGPVGLEGLLTSSCRPFGEALRITRADGPAIYEINDRPAYDIFLEHVSHLEAENPLTAYQNILMGLPLHSFQTDFQNNPFAARMIMACNERDGSISCAASVNEGEYFTFAVRDAEKSLSDLQSRLTDLRDRTHGRRLLCGFYFNCVSRGKSLYASPAKDISLICKTFPGIPIAGFQSYSQLSPVDHVNNQHHYSGALSLLLAD